MSSFTQELPSKMAIVAPGVVSSMHLHNHYITSSRTFQINKKKKSHNEV